jgi:hypothetical protein
MIIVATEITVAVIESRIMNREKDFCRLKAIRLAMREEMFTRKTKVYKTRPRTLFNASKIRSATEKINFSYF